MGWGCELRQVCHGDRQDVVGVVEEIGHHDGVTALSSFDQHGGAILGERLTQKRTSSLVSGSWENLIKN